MVKFAAGKGYAFSVEEFKALEAETKALDKDEFDEISAAAGVETRPVCSLLFR